jgi:hypothetical protein
MDKMKNKPHVGNPYEVTIIFIDFGTQTPLFRQVRDK